MQPMKTASCSQFHKEALQWQIGVNKGPVVQLRILHDHRIHFITSKH